MIELFEKTLLDGGDLEQARRILMDQITNRTFEQRQVTEHDFRVATLVRECLINEPKGTPGYAVAKGIMSRLREKYQDPQSKRLARQLKRDVNKANREEQKDDDGKREYTKGSTTETTSGSEGSNGEISAGIPT